MYYDAIEEIEENVLSSNNTEYDFNNTIIATFNSLSDADQFCNNYNHNNGYNGLKLGQRIQVNDGTYNKAWYIAGFDMEYNQIASDGSTYDNGYGICLIPENSLTTEYVYFHTTYADNIGYIGSIMHTSTLQIASNNLKRVLGNHLINRNVLLSNSYNTSNGATCIWSRSYCTLMSIYQIIGNSYYNSIKYGIGEASYHLPVFKFIHPGLYGYDYWTRCVTRSTSYTGNPIYEALGISRNDIGILGNVIINVWESSMSNKTGTIRPMIYIR